MGMSLLSATGGCITALNPLTHKVLTICVPDYLSTGVQLDAQFS